MQSTFYIYKSRDDVSNKMNVNQPGLNDAFSKIYSNKEKQKKNKQKILKKPLTNGKKYGKIILPLREGSFFARISPRNCHKKCRF